MQALEFVVDCHIRDPVAQVVEQRPFKADVEGSSPSWVTFFPDFTFCLILSILGA